MTPTIWSILLLVLPLSMVAMPVGVVVSETFGWSNKNSIVAAYLKKFGIM